MRWRWLALLGALLGALGCRDDLGQNVPEIQLATPAFDTIEMGCDPDRSRWLLRARATSWTGGATAHVTEDGDYVESHRVPSLQADPEGRWDELELSLRISPDWRDVREGSTTAFPCTARVQVVVQLYDIDGTTIVDCWQAGDQPALWDEVRGISGCP